MNILEEQIKKYTASTAKLEETIKEQKSAIQKFEDLPRGSGSD